MLGQTRIASAHFYLIPMLCLSPSRCSVGIRKLVITVCPSPSSLRTLFPYQSGCGSLQNLAMAPQKWSWELPASVYPTQFPSMRLHLHRGSSPRHRAPPLIPLVASKPGTDKASRRSLLVPGSPRPVSGSARASDVAGFFFSFVLIFCIACAGNGNGLGPIEDPWDPSKSGDLGSSVGTTFNSVDHSATLE